MDTQQIGLLHPGTMGVSLAATAQNSGNQVLWVSKNRSRATRERAEAHDLQDAGSLEELCRSCSTLVSVCPPHAAEDMAISVIRAGFKGIYVDANAISPQLTQKIGQRFDQSDVAFVDGGIIGGPAWEPGTTWLYLSGSSSAAVAELFNAGPLETEVLSDQIGQASAIKMCFAANTKGTTALLSLILAAAEQLGVREALERQWDRYENGFTDTAHRRATKVTAKSWRFAGEMEQIAETFTAVRLPGDFHQGAAEIYRRTADFKNRAEPPALEEVLASLLRHKVNEK